MRLAKHFISFCNKFNKLIKRVGKKRQNARLAEHFISISQKNLINSIIQEHECYILFII